MWFRSTWASAIYVRHVNLLTFTLCKYFLQSPGRSGGGRGGGFWARVTRLARYWLTQNFSLGWEKLNFTQKLTGNSNIISIHTEFYSYSNIVQLFLNPQKHYQKNQFVKLATVALPLKFFVKIGVKEKSWLNVSANYKINVKNSFCKINSQKLSIFWVGRVENNILKKFGRSYYLLKLH